MKKKLECEEHACRFFQSFYQVRKVGQNGFSPDFELTEKTGKDKRCTHPSVDFSRKYDGNNIGAQIQSLPSCPKKKFDE